MYLTSAPFLGGALYGLRSIVRQLDRKRFRPVVVLAEESAELADFFRGVDVELATLRTRSLNRPTPLVAWDLGRAAWELAGLVRKYSVQILHSTAPRAAVLGPVVRQLTGVKFVWQIAVLGVQDYVHFLARFADRAPCVSRAVYEEFGRRPNMQVVYNGPWTEGLRPEEWAIRRRELRQELGIAEDALVVGSIANLQYWKGIHILFESFTGVARQLPETYLVHLGGPVPGYEAYAGEIDAMYERLALVAHVRRLGFCEDAYRYYPVFDLFVHAPVREGRYRTTEAFGHSVAEAMGYRLPVIASRLGGPAEIVEEGVTGELVEPENAAELAEKILALLADPERRHRMGQAGYARYRRYFAIEREVDHYQRIYEELAADRRRVKDPRETSRKPKTWGFHGYWKRVLAEESPLASKCLREIELAPFARSLARALETRNSVPARVLEVGAGRATASRLLAERYQGVFCALDIVPEAVAVARRAMGNGRQPPLHLIVADVHRAPFPAESFDLVFSQGLIEHFEDPSQMLAAHVALVKPGGWLVISVPQKYNLFTLYKRWRMRRGQWPPGWETEYSAGQLAALGRNFELEVSDLDGHGTFLCLVAHRLLRSAVPARFLAGMVRAFDDGDRLLGKRLRASLCLNLVMSFRKPADGPVKGEVGCRS
jgi:glycosyltransferase involved in cell wall biosynthesis/SAM-dependent methyltransferase